MRQRGYLVAFMFVLLAACVAGYFGGRFLLRRLQQDFGSQSTWSPPTVPAPAATGQASAMPPSAMTPTPSSPGARAPAPTAAVPTRVVITVPAPAGVEVPTDVQTPLADTPAPEVTPAETETAFVSPSPAPAYPFGLAQPVRHSTGDCPGSYIQGLVSDRAGRPLPDVRLLLTDEYGNRETTATKAGGDAGRYDFPLFGPPRRFYLTVVDAGDRPISPKVEIPHGVGADPQAQCHWADWQRQ